MPILALFCPNLGRRKNLSGPQRWRSSQQRLAFLRASGTLSYQRHVTFGALMADQSDLPAGARPQNSAVVVSLNEYKQSLDPAPVTFHRRELDAILWIYGRMVGEGEWKDYAIDHLKDRAIFSVFKRSGEMPLFRIEKNPKLAAKQGAYSIINTNGMILKRGHELPQVLKVFDKALKLID